MHINSASVISLDSNVNKLLIQYGKNKGDLHNSDFSLIILKYSITVKSDQVQILKSILFWTIFIDCSVYLSPTSNLP